MESPLLQSGIAAVTAALQVSPAKSEVSNGLQTPKKEEGSQETKEEP